MPEQRFDVTAGAYHMENQNVLTFDSVEDDVLARGKTPQARAQILIAPSSNVGVTGKKEKPLGDGIDHAVGNLNAAAFLGRVIPDAVKLGFGMRGDTVRHQRPGVRSAAKRARPRCFTSAASSRMDCCVIVRPSPRAREAS